MGLVVTVSQINRRLALLIKGDKPVQNISVKGEIADYKEHYKTGHIFFRLCDGESSIKAVMFRSYAEKLKFEPEDGMNVIVSGSVQLYEKDGACQLYAYSIEQGEGLGDGLLSFEQLKKKLGDEGLFDQKRPLPTRPKSVCVVTSETGAALHDILNILSRRWPFIKVVLVPVMVQGAEAPTSVANGLKKAQNTGCDLIIFGRGGGSSEDLSAFNTEIVARAVYESKIPTISAVGHEIDYTIADFAADRRAPTPSAAAEIAVPDINEIMSKVNALFEQTANKAKSGITALENRVDSIERLISALSPAGRAEADKQKVSSLFTSVRKSFLNVLTNKSSRFAKAAELIDAFDPMKTLERGYSVVFKDGKVLTSADNVSSGDRITVKMHDGEFEAVVADRI